MADYLTTTAELTSIADAIRTKGQTSAALEYPTEFVSAIQAISTGIDVSDTTATENDVLNGKYFYTASGDKTQGSLGNTSIAEGTTTVSGTTATRGTATWGNGVISSGEMGAATFANIETSGQTYVDISGTTAAPVLVAGDYLYINKGYSDNLKISLAKLVPDGSDVKGHDEYILSGHSAYDNDGTLVAGSIPTIASTDLSVNGKTVTVPVGYYTGASGATAVSASVAEGTVTSGTATISSVLVSAGSDDDKFSLSGSANVSAPTVGTAGYISSTSGTKNAKSGGATLDATIDKIIGTATIPATLVKPTVSKQSVPSGVTDAASGNATTTAPSSGVYVAVKSATTVETVTPTVSITKQGYGTSSKHGITTSGVSVGAQASDKTYIPITTANPKFDGGALSGNSTATGTNVVLSTIDNGIEIQTKYTASCADVLYNGAVSGWVNKSDNVVALAQHSKSVTNGNVYYVHGVTVPENKNFSITGAGTTTFTSGSSTTGNLTASAYNSSGDYEDNKSIVSDGKWVATNATESGTYYGRVTVADGAYSASVSSHSVTTTPVVTGSLSGTVTSIGTTTKPSSGTDGTDYWTITPSGSVTTTGISTAKGKATIGTAGYIATGNKESTASTVNITPTVSAGTARYLTKAVIAGSSTNATATTTVAPGTVSVAKQDVPSGVTNAASGDATTTAPSSGVYVAVKATAAANSTGTTSSITGSGSATVTTAGYAPTTLTGTVSVSGTATAKTSSKDSSMTYVPITTATPSFNGGAVSGTATASSSAGATLSTSENNSGITIAAAASATREIVRYSTAVNGWVTKSASDTAYAASGSTALTPTTYYLNGVTLATPDSDSRTFTVTAPSGGTDHVYTFTQSADGRTTIKVDETLTMQWNATDESLDFIYT